MRLIIHIHIIILTASDLLKVNVKHLNKARRSILLPSNLPKEWNISKVFNQASIGCSEKKGDLKRFKDSGRMESALYP